MKQTEKQSVINYKRNQNGFSFLELLIAMAIFSIGILGVMTMQLSSSKANTSARKITEASGTSQFQIEALLNVPFNTLDTSMSIGATDTANALGLIPSTVFNMSDGNYTINVTMVDKPDFDGDGNSDMLKVLVDATGPDGKNATYTFTKYRTIN